MPVSSISILFIIFRLRQHLAAITSAALTAVDARRVTASALESLDTVLRRESDLSVVAAGKAAVGMATAIQASLGSALSAGVMTAATTDVPSPAWQAFPSTHPRP